MVNKKQDEETRIDFWSLLVCYIVEFLGIGWSVSKKAIANVRGGHMNLEGDHAIIVGLLFLMASVFFMAYFVKCVLSISQSEIKKEMLIYIFVIYILIWILQLSLILIGSTLGILIAIILGALVVFILRKIYYLLIILRND